MVAMTPLIAIQLLGLAYKLREKNARKAVSIEAIDEKLEWFDDYEIIAL